MKMYFMSLVYFFGCTTWLAVPPPGFKPGAPEGRAVSPNHWTAGEFPGKCILKVHKHCDGEGEYERVVFSSPQLISELSGLKVWVLPGCFLTPP